MSNARPAAVKTRKRKKAPRRTQERTEITRAKLIEAATRLFTEHGYEGVTLSEIARRADVSTPAVYSHFAGKADLLVAASKRELEAIGGSRLPANLGLRTIARQWLSPDFAGIRPKLSGAGEGFRDFVVTEESEAGWPGFVNLIGIESPGLTAAPAIAARVVELLAGLS